MSKYPKRIRFIKYNFKDLSTRLIITLHNVLQQQNNTLDSVYGLKNNYEKFNCLPYINWLTKMHKIAPGAKFIIACKKCINKQLSKHVTSAFKLCHSQIHAYHKKTYYFSGTKTFSVIQNNSLPLECISKINKVKNAKLISTFFFLHFIQRCPTINCLIFYIKF